MITEFQKKTDFLSKNPSKWLVTGVAGFIGSHLLEYLLSNNQIVVGVDNFSTGRKVNLESVQSALDPKLWGNFTFHEASVCDAGKVGNAIAGVDYVLHQAALGSVPRSIKDPLNTNDSNITGFLTVLSASQENKVKRFVYASSSSVYGDSPVLPKVEANIGKPLSPYAVTKYVDELYASVFSNIHALPTTGLRYFNVFGPRQDPEGAYAAVIPRWIATVLKGDDCKIFGDGETSRDFCFIKNVVQANILSALSPESIKSSVYNVAVGDRTTLTELYKSIEKNIEELSGESPRSTVQYEDFRPGDITHSLADISAIQKDLGYQPEWRVGEGLKETVRSFL